jgi:hypothetical protein
MSLQPFKFKIGDNVRCCGHGHLGKQPSEISDRNYLFFADINVYYLEDPGDHASSGEPYYGCREEWLSLVQVQSGFIQRIIRFLSKLFR